MKSCSFMKEEGEESKKKSDLIFSIGFEIFDSDSDSNLLKK